MRSRWLSFGYLFTTLLVASSSTSAEDRKVLAELFTSTTCPPCYNADVYYFQTWGPSFPDSNRLITIAYHVWWPSPGDDPMYLANTPPIRARVPFCQGSSAYVPRMYIDGKDATSAYATWPGMITSALTVASPLKISMAGVRDSTAMKVTVSVTATEAVNSLNWRLHCVVTEDGISAPQASSSGYKPFVHECAHRGMYPSSDGVPLTIAQGETITGELKINFLPAWKPANCRVVAFVQDNSSKAVQQAEEISVISIPWGVVSVAEDPAPAQFALDQNFPNPFNPSTRIRYTLAGTGDRGTGASDVRLVVYDLLGREVAVLVHERQAPGSYDVGFDAGSLSSGVYIYSLTAGSFLHSRKMLLMR